MARSLYKMTEFKSESGHWHIGDFSHVGQIGNAWYFPARVLGMGLEDYVNMLINEYHVIPVSYTEYEDGRDPFFLFNWTDYKTAHSFLLRVNKEARKKQFYINYKD